MSKAKDVIRYYRPAPYSRPVREGEEVPARRVYHPRRAAHPSQRKILHPLGERVVVRAADTYHWKRLTVSGDVIEMTEAEYKKAADAHLKALEKAKAKATKAAGEAKEN